jgi:hypothetical protein
MFYEIKTLEEKILLSEGTAVYLSIRREDCRKHLFTIFADYCQFFCLETTEKERGHFPTV